MYNEEMDEVAEVKSKLDITEIVGGYVQLKQSGRNLKAPCPFHPEKTASFMVSPEKGIFHCFGCNEGGDIFVFVQKMEGLDFRGALELLARRAGVELKAKRGENKAASNRKKRLLEAHELATRYYQQSLIQNRKAAEYAINDRGLTKATLGEWKIGYSPDAWNGLLDFLHLRGFSREEMLDSGLGKQNESSDSVYDTFRGRLMFPICDREGRTIGFTARVLDDSLPKYLNTPQTPLYDKSQALFGLHLAKQAIRETKEVVIVEGNMDVVASHQAGIKQVVASSGTALTIDQLRTLSKMTKTIKLAFDRDRAGLVATERAIELGQKLGLNLSVVTLKEAKDADELISRDPDEWREAIQNAPYIVDYLFDQFKLEYDLTSAMGKRQYTDRLATNLKRLADPVERDHYLKKLAEAVGVSEEAVQAKLDQSPEAASTPAELKRAPVQNTPQRRSNHDQLEESVLALALSYPVTRMSLQDLRLEDFSLTERQLIFTALKSHVHETGTEVIDSLTEYRDYGNILLLRGEQDFTDIPPADRSFEAFQLARRLRIATNQEIKENLSQQLHEAESSGDVVLARKLLEQYQAILTEEI